MSIGGDGVGLASGTAPEDFGGTMLRLLAYMAGLAVLGVLGVIFFRLPDVVAAVAPAPRPQWIEVERPHPAFELVMPELGGPASRYAIFRREADGARKDVLSGGEAAGRRTAIRMIWLEEAVAAGRRLGYLALSITCRAMPLLTSQKSFASANCKCTLCESCFWG